MYQICVSGAAKGKSVEEGKSLAYSAGQEIAKAGHLLLTGATSGLPDYAAHGSKAEGGQSVGISPASTKAEHILKYHLPTGCYDTILFTGLHYVGRDSLLVASSDAVISIGGRLGTLHEFTISMEMDKPIAFLMGAGGISSEIKDIMRAAGKAEDDPDVIFDADPRRIVAKLTKRLNEIHSEYRKIYREGAVCEVCEDLEGHDSKSHRPKSKVKTKTSK